MKITYDPDADCLYIYLRQGDLPKIADTLDASEYIYVDVDDDERPIGIEVTHVSLLLGEAVTEITLEQPQFVPEP